MASRQQQTKESVIQQQADSILGEAKRLISVRPEQYEQMQTTSTDSSSSSFQKIANEGEAVGNLKRNKDDTGNLTRMLQTGGVQDRLEESKELNLQKLGSMALPKPKFPHTKNISIAKESAVGVSPEQKDVKVQDEHLSAKSLPKILKFSPVQIGQMLSKDGKVVAADLGDAANLMSSQLSSRSMKVSGRSHDKSPAEKSSMYNLERTLLIEGLVSVQGSWNRLESFRAAEILSKWFWVILVIWLVAFGAACILWHCGLNQMLQGVCTCVLYLIVSAALDIAVLEVESHSISHLEPAHAVAVVEAGKLLVSFAFLKIAPQREGSFEEPEPLKVYVRDFAGFALPVVFFISSTTLILHVMKNDELSDAGTFRMTSVLWTAGIWAWVFEARLGRRRIVSLVCIFLGVCASHIWSLITATFSKSVLLMCTVAFLETSTLVTAEFAMKRKAALDINLQNTVFYGLTFTTSLAFAIASGGFLSDVLEFFRELHSSHAVLFVLQVTMGLLVSRILKYNDSIVLAVLMCLRGSCVMLTRPMFGLALLPPSQISLASSIVVAVAACSLFTRGQLSVIQDTERKKDKQAEHVILHSR